ncbi:hypothetical protein BKA63DRAFT_520292 [Paraphoma chrysanthemicola]|nr:hypothetical protein BKA63DRAFT_520292 [Paraphoma chrysanthemicola]
MEGEKDRATKLNVGQDDLVRGKRRQRRKAPKSRSGCVTCKIRRVKCGEEKPDCKNCVSTGRKCDGYPQHADRQDQAPATKFDAELVYRNKPAVSKIASSDLTSAVERAELCHTPSPSTLSDSSSPECVNTSPWPSITYSPIPHSMGRAFHYFLHQSSINVAGPLHVHAWHSHVLRMALKSPTILHAVSALSGLHEQHHSSSISLWNDGRQTWRQYNLAVKQTNSLVAAAQENEMDVVAAREEILTACAIFITIELLLGNLGVAVQHLEGGFSLIQACLSASCVVMPGTRTDTTKTNPPPHLDARLSNLIGFFARLELQMMSLLPPDRYAASVPPIHPSSHAVSETCRPLPITLSAHLYRIVKRSLYWIQHHASEVKYASSIPPQFHDAQSSLLDDLERWRIAFKKGERELGDIEGDNITPENAQLLITYHLTSLKLRTALSTDERDFSTPESMDSFRALVEHAQIVLRQRSRMESQALFVTLETSTCEPLYYTAIKCRARTLRRRALELLKLAGPEGVWNGHAMAVVAQHVIDLEERQTGVCVDQAESHGTPHGLQSELNGSYAVHSKHDGLSSPNVHEAEVGACHGELIGEVLYEIDTRSQRVEVEGGWFLRIKGCWRYDKRTLSW